ncbi:Na+/H+ antiporter NhaC family protein [Shouchella patagoniensis]|uniref:Na+/H+ antiporter NhaC family protein n=1 Tax=Shouchella patagoniensis TaxID=228576 RepID=UPI000994A5EB|nr:Na+/H+ antiporter NhaC family protein [Shouchella patagoniensis]
MEHFGWISLIPPILALTLVILTRKVLISLGIAILVGAFIAFDQHVGQALAGIFQTIAALFLSFDTLDEPTISGVLQAIGEAGFVLNNWELYIMLFLLFLGMVASLITFSGGGQAFSRWAAKRITTRKGALFLPFFLGLVIFIDDYFNALTVGNMSRPLTDRYRVSRAKLAYIVDSTSAPICVLMPLSSWGAYIIGVMATILVSNQITEYSAFQAFMYTVPMNFYALIALLFLILIIIFNIDIGLMKKHEVRAKENGQLTDPAKGAVVGDLDEELVMKNGRIYQLFVPILVLIASTVSLLFYTGAQGAAGEGEAITVLTMMEYTDIGFSLLIGSIIGFVTSVGVTLSAKPVMADFGKAIKAGLASMLPAIYILILAWTTIEMIDRLGTGQYLAGLVDQSIDPRFLPVMIFLMAAISGLATGTSWGTFGILLPIAGQMAVVIDPSMLIPMFAAVLAGSIFGDHISPISDSTILSAAGSGSHHMDHVITQLPYAVFTAVIAAMAFLVLGFFGIAIAWIAALILLALVVFVLQVLNKKQTSA